MNQYVTVDDFKALFQTDLDDKTLNLKLSVASEKIDTVTFNRIVAIGFDNLTSFQQEKIKLAVCFQANHIIENGINSNVGLSGFSVLDISVSYDSKQQTEAEKLDMSNEALDFISKTGLTNRSFRGW